jgi:hypothetical protein
VACNWTPITTPPQLACFNDTQSCQVNCSIPNLFGGLKDLNLSLSYSSDSATMDSEPLSINYSGPLDSCTYTSGNWAIVGPQLCTISSINNLGGNNITCTGIGYVRFTAKQSNVGGLRGITGCNVSLRSSGNVTR